MVELVRWKLRFTNYLNAFKKLHESVEYIKENILNVQDTEDAKSNEIFTEMLKEGLIQRFEYTHELAWNLMKDYAFYQGNSSVGGSRDATREAFSLKLISDGDVWIDMIRSRNKTSHTYNEEIVNEIVHKILNQYMMAFLEFKKVMEEKFFTS